MRIFIDIGHPAHVHYFRNFIKIMEGKGHVFFISARDRSIIHSLLNKYNLEFYNRGKGMNGIFGKLSYMFYADFLLLKQAKRFKPDMFLSFASPYAAQTAWLLGKPHIAMDDTEHAKFGQLFYKPFSKVFLNPFCFYKDFGNKQIRFNSYVEHLYLHPSLYSPKDDILKILNLKKDQKYVILRFVSWQANHDIGHSGIDDNIKIFLINSLERKYRVFISSEAEVTDFRLKKYLIKIPPELMHDALFYADFFITESGTMASEAAILNTPVIYVNSLPLMGYLIDEERNGMLFHYKTADGVLDKIEEFMVFKDIKKTFKKANSKLLEGMINPTSFLCWFIEEYPDSFSEMKKNPDFQLRFM